ncbi:hypothetical protein [Metapseudomonas resinovorans]|uniref:DUF5666 domain-containing protein n=1 Tax=Metapseudomonas resinovorans NBRC 106553 TaxID=1245471 RepID=S6AGG2_METRE|nr:hypothetical protein [Pseudomonas resinovorans]BAN49382.1 hypothetical protein PCA10_36500 [Pseudomonas resinovorans NBRC 106553]
MHHAKSLAALFIALTAVGGCSSPTHDEGLTATASSASSFTPGVPGGVDIQTVQVTAVITAIDQQRRTFTLQDDQGNRQTFDAVPEMRNFSQLKVGDRVNAVVTHERVVRLREPNATSTDGVAGVVATAPEGSRPGMLVAGTKEITAVVKAIDTTQHTATLQFPDGSSKVVRVRPDIELKPSYLNKQVVISLTSAMAISVEAP